MFTLGYSVTYFNSDQNNTDTNKSYRLKEHACTDMKAQAYELLQFFSGHNYSIEEMTNTSFELEVMHDDGSVEVHQLSVE